MVSGEWRVAVAVVSVRQLVKVVNKMVSTSLKVVMLAKL